MFLQPPWLPSLNQVEAPKGWNPTVFKNSKVEFPDLAYGLKFSAIPEDGKGLKGKHTKVESKSSSSSSDSDSKSGSKSGSASDSDKESESHDTENNEKSGNESGSEVKHDDVEVEVEVEENS